MDKDFIISQTPFKVRQLEGESITENRKAFAVSVLAENDSYMPLDNQSVSLFATNSAHLHDMGKWHVVTTSDGKVENEFEYAYPMQKVATKEEFMLVVEDGQDVYLIARLNGESKSESPANFEEVQEDPMWALTRLL